MGSLTPGVTQIYERDGNNIYARDTGATERRLIGQNIPRRRDPLQYDLLETQKWQDIVEAGKTNPALQKVLDRAILLYNTIKEHHD
jgi:hypothetical protein